MPWASSSPLPTFRFSVLHRIKSLWRVMTPPGTFVAARPQKRAIFEFLLRAPELLANQHSSRTRSGATYWARKRALRPAESASMELLRYRTPVGLSSRLQQQQYTEPKRCFSVSPRYNRHRRSCRSTKTETITRAPPDDEQKQIQHGSSDSNGDSHQWDAQENLVNLITALPIPSPQEVLDSASSPVPQPLEDVPEKVAETVRQAPGAAPFTAASHSILPPRMCLLMSSLGALIVCLG